jgi:hypothetical protein
MREYDRGMIEGDGRGLDSADEGGDCGLEFIVLEGTGRVDVNCIYGA